MNVVKVDKSCKPGITVEDKPATRVEVKAKRKDKGGVFYVYDLFGENNTCLALNRYAFNHDKEKPFEELTKEEDLVLNPTSEVEPEVI